MRRLRALASRRADPPRPPRDASERERALGAPPETDRYITGNGLAARCRHVLNYEEPAENERAATDWWFCKVDYLDFFFREVAPAEPFVLVSHNGDLPIGRRFARHLRRSPVVAWFAANVELRHPRLHAIPLGIANPFWPHGDGRTLEAVQARGLEKTHLFDVGFSTRTNPAERLRCLEQTGLELQEPVDFPAHLERLASSSFCISPRGNGIDAHRTWEALYLRTIPVVTRSVLTDQHPELPMVVLDDWSQFRSIEFGPDLYARIWGDWDPGELALDRYLERLAAIVRGHRLS